jgi:LuxR family maltose regulon positive regulatory protein
LLPKNAHLGRGIAFGHHGSAQLMLGNMNQARQSLERSIQLLERLDWPGLMIFRNYYAHFLLSAGLIGQALLLLKDIYQNAHARNIQKGNTFSDTLIGYGIIEYEWNNLKKAGEYVQEGVKLAEGSISADRLVQAYEAMFRVAPALGNLDKMQQKLKRLDEVAAQYNYPPYFQDRIQALWARLALAEGDLFEARRWRHYFEWSHQKKITALQRYEWHTVALVYLAEKDYAKSIHLLRQFQALSRQQVRTQDEIITGVDLVRALFAGGFEQQAKEEVAVLLSLALPEGYVRTFVDGGPVVRRLLERLLYEYGQDEPVKERAPAKQIAYITHILTAFGPDGDIQPVQAITSATVVVDTLLTPREKDVVSLLAQGMTYADIASQLVITENTLKYHIKHIYSKLQVRNRTEAVLKAQKLQLI